MHLGNVLQFRIDSQVRKQASQQSTLVRIRLEEKSSSRRMLHLVQQVKQQGRLPHPGFRDQGRKSPFCFNRIDYRCKRLGMRRAEIEIPGVGSHPEWLVAKAKIFEQLSLAAC